MSAYVPRTTLLVVFLTDTSIAVLMCWLLVHNRTEYSECVTTYVMQRACLISAPSQHELSHLAPGAFGLSHVAAPDTDMSQVVLTLSTNALTRSVRFLQKISSTYEPVSGSLCAFGVILCVSPHARFRTTLDCGDRLCCGQSRSCLRLSFRT
jgi:hypothetical protein